MQIHNAGKALLICLQTGRHIVLGKASLQGHTSQLKALLMFLELYRCNGSYDAVVCGLVFFLVFFCFFFFFVDVLRQSLCILGCPKTHYADQAVFELTQTSLSLPPTGWD